MELLRRQRIGSHLPDSVCEHCKPAASHETDEELFDEHGYPIVKTDSDVRSGALDETYTMTGSLSPENDEAANSRVFRFLDLPPELRNRIYELAFSCPAQPVCVPDHLLRPSQGLKSTTEVLRTCFSDVTCLPCQLHALLGTASSGLSRVSQQLHHETALVPYMVNTFSLHNLYYLQAFLEVIGENARQHFRSLRFVCKMPQGERRSLGIQVDVIKAFALLGECTALVRLEMEVDVENLLARDRSGNERAFACSIWMRCRRLTRYMSCVV